MFAIQNRNHDNRDFLIQTFRLELLTQDRNWISNKKLVSRLQFLRFAQSQMNFQPEVSAYLYRCFYLKKLIKNKNRNVYATKLLEYNSPLAVY